MKIPHIFYMLIFISILFQNNAASSSNNNEDTKHLPIEIKTIPNPVLLDKADDKQNCYDYCSMVIEEKAGIGFKLISWKTENYDETGKFIYSNQHKLSEFEQEYWHECDKFLSNYLKPNMKLCTSPGRICLRKDVKYKDHIFTFIDKNEKEIIVKCRQYFGESK